MACTERLLTSLRESITEPYIIGTLQPPDSCFSLFYKVTKDGHAARHINLTDATPDELEQLTQACEPTSFGMNQENVLDETYCKAGKMDSECFTPMLDPVYGDLLENIRTNLLEGTRSTKRIKTELYKLKVYGKGSFFKPHVDTPRSEKMFGSLVVVFPTPHEGGALLLRHHGSKWTFDFGRVLATMLAIEGKPSIGYVAFFSDVEHEVAPVISGHRITLTYNLYFDDSVPVPANEGAFREAFKALLENPEFLADGGTLAFGLKHVYTIEKNLEHVYSALKGSDAVVYRSVRALGYEPVLYLYYQDPPENHYYNQFNQDQGIIIDKLLGELPSADYSLRNILLYWGGIRVSQDTSQRDREIPRLYLLKHREQVEWVTPKTEFNRQKGTFIKKGREVSLKWAYGDVCLVVRIGKAGDRLEYTTVGELQREVLRRRLADDEEEW